MKKLAPALRAMKALPQSEKDAALAGWETDLPGMLHRMTMLVLEARDAKGERIMRRDFYNVIHDYLMRAMYVKPGPDLTPISMQDAMIQQDQDPQAFTTAAELGEAYKNCGANMNAAGQDIETTTSMLESLANNGLNVWLKS